MRETTRAAFAAAAILLVPLASVPVLSTATAGASGVPGSLVMGPQAMEGNLVLAPGTVLEAGYDLTIPGSHPATAVTFENPAVVFQAKCVSGGAPVTVTVTMSSVTYAVPANDSDWFPSGDQHSPLVYEGQTTVPDACAGGDVSFQAGGTFSTTVDSDVAVPGDGVHVRWHYSANGTSGSWSGTAHVQPGKVIVQI